LNASPSLSGLKTFLFGISDASPEKMSGLHNLLIMDGKFEAELPAGGSRELLRAETWGKSHMELRVDTQFVRFPFPLWHTTSDFEQLPDGRKGTKNADKRAV
jgi:hypothetical protein